MIIEKGAIPPDTVQNIQALRTIAALLVLCAHIKLPIRVLNPSAANYSFIHSGHGAIGVDLFFIISGYVICLTACKRHHGSLDFFLARIARVAPLYLVYMGLFLFCSVVIGHDSYPWQSVWNGIFYLPIFDRHTLTIPPGGLGWSLCFEMWFYTAFALLLNLTAPRRAAIFLPLIFLVGASVMTFYRGDWYFPRFMFHPLVLEFAMGCIIFNTQKQVSGLSSWLLLILGIVWAVCFSGHTGNLLGYSPPLLGDYLFLAWIRVIVWGIPMALVVAGLVGLERNRGYVFPRAVVWLGGISYSIYLSQQLWIEMIQYLGQWLGLHSLALLVPLFFALCISGSWLCWRVIEKPFTLRAHQLAKKFSMPSGQPEVPVARALSKIL